jgi:hypothetical protein
LKEVLRGFTKNRAATDPASPDERLRGRTYTIPFENVWQAAISLTGGGLGRWSIVMADDQAGIIDALYRTRIFSIETDVWIQIGLDQDAQTRVDIQAASRTERTDLGLTKRTIGYFFRKLDAKLSVKPGQILDPTRSNPKQEHS